MRTPLYGSASTTFFLPLSICCRSQNPTCPLFRPEHAFRLLRLQFLLLLPLVPLLLCLLRFPLVFLLLLARLRRPRLPNRRLGVPGLVRAHAPTSQRPRPRKGAIVP